MPSNSNADLFAAAANSPSCFLTSGMNLPKTTSDLLCISSALDVIFASDRAMLPACCATIAAPAILKTLPILENELPIFLLDFSTCDSVSLALFLTLSKA